MGFLSDDFETPYYAVIFASVRSGDDQAAYEAKAAEMLALAAEQDGYLGVESVGKGADGITVSYWRDEAAIKAWRDLAEHRAAQEEGREVWYENYRLRVARVERSHGKF